MSLKITIFTKHEAKHDGDNSDQTDMGGRKENLYPFLTFLNPCKESKVPSPFKDGREDQGH